MEPAVVPPEFADAVVRSVVLNALLARDFVPTWTHPPRTEEIVGQELPRLLGMHSVLRDVPGLRARLGGGFLVDELDVRGAADPAALLRRYVGTVLGSSSGDGDRMLLEAGRLIRERGHRDFVYSVLKYMRKPATATEAHIRRLVRDVSAVLDVEPPADCDDRVALDYAHAHADLIRV
jgi:hypothetical protein